MRTRERGQSMLEAIIATGIIVTAVSSALTLVASSVKASKQSEIAIVAGNLAREGIEVVRAIRDSNWLAGIPFNNGLGSGADYAGIPAFTPTTNTWSMNYAAADATTDAAAAVWRHTGTAAGSTLGLMVQAAAQPANTTATPFSRIVQTFPLCSDGAGGYVQGATLGDCAANGTVGIRAVSRVMWRIAGSTRELVIEERLFDWR